MTDTLTPAAPCTCEPGRELCVFGTCSACDMERFCRFDEKEQARNPLRHEFGTADWLADALAAGGFVEVLVGVERHRHDQQPRRARLRRKKTPGCNAGPPPGDMET